MVTGIVWSSGTGTLRFHVGRERGRSIGPVALETVHVLVEDVGDEVTESRAEAEMERQASLPVQPHRRVDAGIVLAPGHEASQQHVQLETNGMNEGVGAHPAPTVQLLVEEQSAVGQRSKVS